MEESKEKLMLPNELITAKQASDILGCHRTQLDALIARGELDVFSMRGASGPSGWRRLLLKEQVEKLVGTGWRRPPGPKKST